MNNHFKNKNKKNHWWGFQIFDLSQIPKFWSIFWSQIRNFLRKKKTLSYLSCQLSPKNCFFKFKPKGKIFSSSKFFFYSLSLSLSSLSLETALSSSLDVHDVHFSLVTAAAGLPSSVAVVQILVLLLQGKKITSSENRTNVVRTLLFLNNSSRPQ